MPKYTTTYKRADSSFWWIAYVDPSTRKRVYKSSGFRIDHPSGRRKALDMARELSKEAIAGNGGDETGGWTWVGPWLRLRHRTKERTLVSEQHRWSQVAEYLDTKGIRSVRDVTYEHALEYLDWRMGQIKRVSKKHPKYNTALQEVRFLGRVMREAERRGYLTTANPLNRLGLKKDHAKEKPEMTDAEIVKIREELKTRPEWMQVSFEIALHQGCRLRETSIPWSKIDLSAGTVQFHAKRDNIFTTKLHPELVPLLTKLKADGNSHTCVIPKMATKEWHFLFKEIGLPHLCFHCTRTTVVTRLARAGVPISLAMAYVGHANETIHRVYQRLKPGDVGPAVAALSGI